MARDCEVVTRQASRDPFENSESQHQTEVEPDSAAFGKTVVAVFQVGRVFNGGARTIGFATSRDAGRTWKRGFLRGLVPRVSDPSISYDRKHGVWLTASLVFGAGRSWIGISRSSDGVHWGPPIEAVSTPGQLGQDKEWIACDSWPQSPHYGTCYLSYSDLESVLVVAQASTDGGRSWSTATTAPGFPGRGSIRGSYAPGVQPLVLPTGRALIPYYDEGRFSTLVSDDGGLTWSSQLGIARADYKPHQGLRAAPLPTSTVSSDGRAYLAWTDCSFRAGCAANDVVYTTTTDGLSWTPVARVPTGAADAELPGLDADPTRPGRLALAYYDYTGSALQARFVSSRDAGASWSRPQAVGSRPVPLTWVANTSLGSMVGDYISTSFAGGRAVPVFVLGTRPAKNGLREAAFATSIPVG